MHPFEKNKIGQAKIGLIATTVFGSALCTFQVLGLAQEMDPIRRIDPIPKGDLPLTPLTPLPLGPDLGTSLTPLQPPQPLPPPQPLQPLPNLSTHDPIQAPVTRTPLNSPTRTAILPTVSPTVRPSSGAGGGSGSGGGGGGPYLPSVLVPTACLAASQMSEGSSREAFTQTCHAINGGNLGWDLFNALNADHPGGAIARILGEMAAEKMVYMSFPRSMGVQERVNVVRGMYAALDRQFNWVAGRIQTELLENPAKAAQLRRLAIADAQKVEALKVQVYAENREAVQRAVVVLKKQYGYAGGGFGGIQFSCALACHQLIGAASGINVFD